MNLEVVLATLLFVMPGFAMSVALDYVLLRRPKGQMERANESILLTILAYVVADWIPTAIFDWTLYLGRLFTSPNSTSSPFAEADVWRDFAFILLLGVVLGILLGWVLRIEFVSRLWSRAFGRNHHPSVWDSVMSTKVQDHVAILEMNDGQWWTGLLEEASDYPGERELLLSSPARINQEDFSVVPSAASFVLVDMSNVSRLMFVPRATYEAGTMPPKPDSAADTPES